MENTKTLKLTKPIHVNGDELKEIPYCFEEMTARDRLQISIEMAAEGIPLTAVEEFDNSYHLFLFAKAAEIASNKKITSADILRISAKDAKTAGALARDFFYL
ncbi:MAG: hypothetical protein VB035_06160 [Candidatus Fimivivens sp.]|nr:hypothetical protein [Candidatus Fimivivens sp.]